MRGFISLAILAVLGALILAGGVGVIAYKAGQTRSTGTEPETASTAVSSDTDAATSSTGTMEADKKPESSAPAPKMETEPKAAQTEVTAGYSETLQIQNVRADITKAAAKITWTTTLPAESRLVLDSGDGKGYESIGGVSTSHEVDISNPEISEEYDYEITASTADKRQFDTYYDSFTAYQRYEVSLDTPDKLGCSALVFKNTAGKLAANTKFLIEVSYSANPGGARVGKTVTTNDEGEVDSWELTDDCGGSVLYSATDSNGNDIIIN
jgi:hypothetical protein